MWSMLISMAVYFFASWKAKKTLSDYGIDGLARAMAAGTVALAASSVVGWGIDAAFPEQAIHLLGSSSASADAQARELDQALKALQAAQSAH